MNEARLHFGFQTGVAFKQLLNLASNFGELVQFTATLLIAADRWGESAARIQ